MPLPSPNRTLRGSSCALVLGLMSWTGVQATPSAAQEISTPSPLTPAGRLRLQYTPSFHLWNDRFGLRTVDGVTVEEVEPLGFDLDSDDGSALFPQIGDLESALRGLLDDPGLEAVLGRTRSNVSASRVEQRFRADVGVKDWLSLGVTVPLVKNRTEITLALRADAMNANLGLNPAVFNRVGVQEYTDALAARTAEAQALADQLCSAGSPDCDAARALAADGASLLSGLLAAYSASPFFLVAASPAGTALADRITSFNDGLTARGLEAVGAAPFATARLTDESLAELFGDPNVGLDSPPLEDRVGRWRLGDIEVHANVRLLEGSLRDSATARARYLVGAGATFRLATGLEDDPGVFLDLPHGDGQADIEVRGFGNLTFHPWGLWADARFGVQMSRELTRRVGPPDLVTVPSINTAVVEWSPGSYRQIDVAPRFQLTDDIALSGAYRFFSKSEDAYTRISEPPVVDPPPVGPVPPLFEDVTLLEAETERTLHELGLGLTYSTLAAWREGEDTGPFEAHLRFYWATAGSGGRTPKGLRTSVTFRIYPRLWGG